MAPLAPNNTAQLFFDYQQGSFEHTLMMRPSPSSTLEGVAAIVDDVLTALATVIVATTIVRVRLQQAGANFSTPVDLSVVGLTYGSGTNPSNVVPTFMTFVGRSTGGRRTKLTIFGIDGALPADWRWTRGESTVVAGALGVLEAGASQYVAIDNAAITWYAYANTGYNAYWIRNVRS